MREPYEEERPWGSFRRFTCNEPTTVKILVVSKDKQNSLQSHASREEFWRVISGELELTIGDTVHTAKEGDEFFVPSRTKHRLHGIGEHNQVLEISFGNFDEDDIMRYEDDYGRV